MNMWFLNQKMSGPLFVNPNIPALTYGRDMEMEPANTFIKYIKRKNKVVKLSDCGLKPRWVEACGLKLVRKSNVPIQ